MRQSQRRRFDDEQVVDRVIELDARWRKCEWCGRNWVSRWPGSSKCNPLLLLRCWLHAVRYESEQLNSQLNSVSKQVAALKKVWRGQQMPLKLLQSMGQGA